MQGRRPTNNILIISLKYSTPVYHQNANNLNSVNFLILTSFPFLQVPFNILDV